MLSTHGRYNNSFSNYSYILTNTTTDEFSLGLESVKTKTNIVRPHALVCDIFSGN